MNLWHNESHVWLYVPLWTQKTIRLMLDFDKTARSLLPPRLGLRSPHKISPRTIFIQRLMLTPTRCFLTLQDPLCGLKLWITQTTSNTERLVLTSADLLSNPHYSPSSGLSESGTSQARHCCSRRCCEHIYIRNMETETKDVTGC
jgi:hypothetical protein